MLQNKDIETLRMLFSSHNYVMTTAELTASKLYYADIKQLLDEGLIERVRRGYYHWTQDYGESEVVIINRLFPDAVLCMETALFYYRYSDRNPAEWNFAIDKNVSKRRTKIDYPFIKAYRVESELVTLGETEGEIDFHKVRIYDRDRTICDVLRNMNKMDKEVFNKAVQGYVKDPKKNIPNLIEYAKVLRVQTRVKELIGVLNAVMSALGSFENKTQLKEEIACEKLAFEGMEIDASKRLVYRGEKEVNITFTEFEILHLLARNPGRVFSKEQIYDIVWKESYSGDYNIIMSHIRNIREKIEDNPSKPIYIQTVWGAGYRFNKNLTG